jgi:hypothetical protein
MIYGYIQLKKTGKSAIETDFFFIFIAKITEGLRNDKCSSTVLEPRVLVWEALVNFSCTG